MSNPKLVSEIKEEGEKMKYQKINFKFGDIIPKGTKVKFKEEKQSYTVRASNIVFAICTKPHNCNKTVLYTIIDWYKKIRNRENLIFCMGAETDKQCEEMLERLTTGQSAVSHRGFLCLDIEGFLLPRQSDKGVKK